jgi:hypothetical protein
VELCTAPPEGSAVICAGELGPVIPRTFPPAVAQAISSVWLCVPVRWRIALK